MRAGLPRPPSPAAAPLDPGRRQALGWLLQAGVCTALGAGGSASAAQAPDPLDRWLNGPATTLRDALLRREVSPVEVAERTATRIRAAGALNAIVEFDADEFLAQARRLMRESPRGRALYGVPVALKDNIDARPYRTTGGTPALREFRPRHDARLVTRLREAGALIAGKTNMDELAAWGTTHNGVYGRTANPYAWERHTGGSSGGSAAAVAARLVPAAIGSDTAGSIRNPAAYCGVVGLRPTHDRVPSQGVLPLARRRDAVGPFARRVEDVVVLDAVLSGNAAPVAPVSLAGLRLGIPKAPFQRDLAPEVERVFGATLEFLRAEGVKLIEAEIPGLEPLIEQVSLITIGGAVRADLAQYLKEARADIDVDEVFRQLWHPAVRGWLGEFFVPTPAIAAAYERAWTESFVQLQSQVRAYFATHRLAAIIAPCVPITAAVAVPGTGDLIIDGQRVSDGVWRNIQNTVPASAWDGPGIALPAGLSRDGLPIGIELDGPLGGDRALLGVALAIERVLPPLPAPSLRPA